MAEDKKDESGVINLRKGIPTWLLTVMGMMGGIILTGIPVIITISKVPDLVVQFQKMTADVGEIKQKIAVQEQRKADEAEIRKLQEQVRESHDKVMEDKLDRLLKKQH